MKRNELHKNSLISMYLKLNIHKKIFIFFSKCGNNDNNYTKCVRNNESCNKADKTKEKTNAKKEK